jgi:hypothetical protein
MVPASTFAAFVANPISMLLCLGGLILVRVRHDRVFV